MYTDQLYPDANVPGLKMPANKFKHFLSGFD